MNDIALTSDRHRVLLDSALFDSTADLAVEGRALKERSAVTELLLLKLGKQEIPGAEDVFTLVLHEDSDDFAELERAHGEGLLKDSLVVSPRERLLAWARRKELSVLPVDSRTELRQLLSPRSLVLRDAAALVLRAKRRKEERPFLIGVNGIDKAGKSSFSERLAIQLRDMGFEVEELSLDLFTAARKKRKAKGYAEPDLLLHKHYDMERLQEQLLQPMFQGRAGELRIDAYDIAKERVSETRVLDLGRKSIVLLEGPFLFKRDYFSSYDFRIYLVSDFEKSLDLTLRGLDGRKRDKRQREFTRRELAAQSSYLQQETPWKRAHLVIKGANSDRPNIVEFKLDSDRYEIGRAL